jgi:hypothetical protein
MARAGPADARAMGHWSRTARLRALASLLALVSVALVVSVFTGRFSTVAAENGAHRGAARSLAVHQRCTSRVRWRCGVLFVGNSYTYVNALPALVRRLARSAGKRLFVESLAEPNATLAQHAAWPETASTIDGHPWGLVVLQEQSVRSAAHEAGGALMMSAARQLVDEARSAGAQPVLFVTWAHEDGWPLPGIETYNAMQRADERSYAEVAVATHAAEAPVGYAWQRTLAQLPTLRLWQPDGSHPTVAGSYLAACVFYAAIFGSSPVGLRFRDGIAPDVARALQAVAAAVVLPHRARWLAPWLITR